MKKFSASLKKGFTLIEILIVIALLGVLAVALLATIDPLEQIRRGNDTATRNAAEEFLSASTRYFTTRQAMPWEGTAPAAAGVTLAAGGAAYIDTLVNAGEIKSNFGAGATLANVTISGTAAGPDSTITVCFLPTSKAMAADPTATKTAVNGAGANCIGTDPSVATNVNICYICLGS